MVAEVPLEDAAVVATPGGGGKCRGGRLWQSGGTWLVMCLVDSASNAAPQFKGSAASVVAEMPFTLDVCRVQTE